MNSNKKLQSALELLTTYGFMIAIAAIVLVVLFYFVAPTSQIIPSTCSAYGNIYCYNIQYYSSPTSQNGNVIIYLSNSGSSPANIVSTNVVINGKTFTGPCSTNLAYPTGNTVVYPGGNTLCTVVINPAVAVGTEVIGKFNLSVTSCNSGLSQFSAQTCGFILEKYTGSFIVYASRITTTTTTIQYIPPILPTTTVPAYYVPITITNPQSTPTPSPYQAEVTIPSFSYANAGEINSQWTNVEFTTGPAATGNTIQAWVENGASSGSPSTVVWLKLTSPIPASSSVTVYMNFMGFNVMSALGPTGEAPTLSTPYGAYDNGAQVFNFYDNFTG
jgi:hypothetical protein